MPLWAALVPVVTLVGLLAASVSIYGADSSAGANQIALMASATTAAIIAIGFGYRWAEIEQAIVDTITVAMKAILILLVVGALIGSWILGGVVPSLVHYGLMFLDPRIFYLAATVMCAVVSLSIGSSWTTAGTVGVALMGVAAGLGLSPAVTAGAVISGAYFGDKMSPLSDTTNLAAGVAEVDLFSHIRNMVWTTAPAFLIAVVLFAGLGLAAPSVPDADTTQTMLALESGFVIGPQMLLPLAVVLAMAAFRIPAFPALMAGAALGAVWAVIFQGGAVAAYAARLGHDGNATAAVWTALFDGYIADTGVPGVDGLLSRGGMSSMLTTVWLILAAMMFGGVMERTGMLARLLGLFVQMLARTGNLILATVLTCIGANILTADQFIAIVVPGRMLAPAYRRLDLAPAAMSRTLEDSATLTSPLVPWNTCGAFMAGTLGVATIDYLPFAFFNLLTPFVAVAYGYLGFKIAQNKTVYKTE